METTNKRLYCPVHNKEVKAVDNCVVSPRCGTCDEVTDYCTQNDNNCETCSLTNYNYDCRNNKLKKEG